MTLGEIHTYDMLRSVDGWGVLNRGRFPAASAGGKAFTIVGGVVSELGQQGSWQFTGRGAARESASSKAALRASLRARLMAISQTARVLDAVTGRGEQFRVPRAHGDQGLLSAALAFARDAQPLAEQFVAHDMPATFLDDLNADIEAFERATSRQDASKNQHVDARARITSLLKAGLAAVRRLDAIVRNRLRDDPAAIISWKSARHIERVPRAKRVAPPAPEVSTSSPISAGK